MRDLIEQVFDGFMSTLGLLLAIFAGLSLALVSFFMEYIGYGGLLGDKISGTILGLSVIFIIAAALNAAKIGLTYIIAAKTKKRTGEYYTAQLLRGLFVTLSLVLTIAVVGGPIMTGNVDATLEAHKQEVREIYQRTTDDVQNSILMDLNAVTETTKRSIALETARHKSVYDPLFEARHAETFIGGKYFEGVRYKMFTKLLNEETALHQKNLADIQALETAQRAEIYARRDAALGEAQSGETRDLNALTRDDVRQSQDALAPEFLSLLTIAAVLVPSVEDNPQVLVLLFILLLSAVIEFTPLVLLSSFMRRRQEQAVSTQARVQTVGLNAYPAAVQTPPPASNANPARTSLEAAE
ncbi:hypothetical protein [Litorimonas sp. WD9-15]|uniref:hypothetical protein n=1 Tax=Litorimonas sp. WD9-15 TaxID=3418716 RepID=UPI003D0119BA